MINFPTITLAIAEEIILGAGATTRQLNTVSLENNPEVTINTSGTTGVITASFDMGLGFVDPVAIDSDDSVVLYKPGLQRIKLVCSVAETDVLVTAQKGQSTQALLEQKADLVDGLIPAEQLPSYVDDVIEVANYAALPVSGETGKIYITIDNSFSYRWSGSVYVQIGSGGGADLATANTWTSQQRVESESDVGVKDVYIGEKTTDSYFSGLGSPTVYSKVGDAVVIASAGIYDDGIRVGGLTGVIIDETTTTDIRSISGIVMDNLGAPSFKVTHQCDFDPVTGDASHYNSCNAASTGTASHTANYTNASSDYASRSERMDSAGAGEVRDFVSNSSGSGSVYTSVLANGDTRHTISVNTLNIAATRYANVAAIDFTPIEGDVVIFTGQGAASYKSGTWTLCSNDTTAAT